MGYSPFCQRNLVPSLPEPGKKTRGGGAASSGSGGGGEGVCGEGWIAAAPGSQPSVGYNLTALSQDTCRAKTRRPTKTGACGDILVSAKPPTGLERCQETHVHAHTHSSASSSHTCAVELVQSLSLTHTLECRPTVHANCGNKAKKA